MANNDNRQEYQQQYYDHNLKDDMGGGQQTNSKQSKKHFQKMKDQNYQHRNPNLMQEDKGKLMDQQELDTMNSHYKNKNKKNHQSYQNKNTDIDYDGQQQFKKNKKKRGNYPNQQISNIPSTQGEINQNFGSDSGQSQFPKNQFNNRDKNYNKKQNQFINQNQGQIQNQMPMNQNVGGMHYPYNNHNTGHLNFQNNNHAILMSQNNQQNNMINFSQGNNNERIEQPNIENNNQQFIKEEKIKEMPNEEFNATNNQNNQINSNNQMTSNIINQNKSPQKSNIILENAEAMPINPINSSQGNFINPSINNPSQNNQANKVNQMNQVNPVNQINQGNQVNNQNSNNMSPNNEIYMGKQFVQGHPNFNNTNIPINNFPVQNMGMKMENNQGIPFFNQNHPNLPPESNNNMPNIQNNQNMQQFPFGINEDGFKMHKKPNKKITPSNASTKSPSGTPNSMVNVNPNVINKNINMNIMGLNFNAQNQKFFSKNNNIQNQQMNSLNNRGSLSMQGTKSTMPNYNPNINLNFLMQQRPSPQGPRNDVPNLLNPNMPLTLGMAMQMNLPMNMPMNMPNRGVPYPMQQNMQTNIHPNQANFNGNKRNQGGHYPYPNRTYKDKQNNEDQQNNLIQKAKEDNPQIGNQIMNQMQNQHSENQKNMAVYQKFKSGPVNQGFQTQPERGKEMPNNQMMLNQKGTNPLMMNQIISNPQNRGVIGQVDRPQQGEMIYPNQNMNKLTSEGFKRPNKLHPGTQNYSNATSNNTSMCSVPPPAGSNKGKKENNDENVEDSCFPIEILVKLESGQIQKLTIKSNENPIAISEILKRSQINEKFWAIVHRKINNAINLSRKILNCKITTATMKNLTLIRNSLFRPDEGSNGLEYIRSNSVKNFGESFCNRMWDELKPSNLDIESTERLNVSFK